jgi:hypothetical protein
MAKTPIKVSVRLCRLLAKYCAVKGAELQRCNSRPETGSFHPMAIEVGCFSVTKSTQFSWNFSAGSSEGTNSFAGVSVSADNDN